MASGPMVESFPIGDVAASDDGNYQSGGKWGGVVESQGTDEHGRGLRKNDSKDLRLSFDEIEKRMTRHCDVSSLYRLLPTRGRQENAVMNGDNSPEAWGVAVQRTNCQPNSGTENVPGENRKCLCSKQCGSGKGVPMASVISSSFCLLSTAVATVLIILFYGYSQQWSKLQEENMGVALGTFVEELGHSELQSAKHRMNVYSDGNVGNTQYQLSEQVMAVNYIFRATLNGGLSEKGLNNTGNFDYVISEDERKNLVFALKKLTKLTPLITGASVSWEKRIVPDATSAIHNGFLYNTSVMPAYYKDPTEFAYYWDTVPNSSDIRNVTCSFLNVSLGVSSREDCPANWDNDELPLGGLSTQKKMALEEGEKWLPRGAWSPLRLFVNPKEGEVFTKDQFDMLYGYSFSSPLPYSLQNGTKIFNGAVMYMSSLYDISVSLCHMNNQRVRDTYEPTKTGQKCLGYTIFLLEMPPITASSNTNQTGWLAGGAVTSCSRIKASQIGEFYAGSLTRNIPEGVPSALPPGTHDIATWLEQVKNQSKTHETRWQAEPSFLVPFSHPLQGIQPNTTGVSYVGPSGKEDEWEIVNLASAFVARTGYQNKFSDVELDWDSDDNPFTNFRQLRAFRRDPSSPDGVAECETPDFEDDATVSSTFLAECYFVTVKPMSMVDMRAVYPRSSSLDDAYDSRDLLQVAVVPTVNMMTDLEEHMRSAKKKAQDILRVQVREQEKQFTMSSTIVVVLTIIASTLIGILLAKSLTRPIKRLQVFINRIKMLEIGMGQLSNLKSKDSRYREIRNLDDALVKMANAVDVFARYVPATVVRNIVRGKEGRAVNVERRVVTTMFSDIEGFTSISEALLPSDLMYLMTHYLTAMVQIVEAYEGQVAEIQGDGLLVYWNTPDDCPDHCSKALAAAIAQQEYVKTLSEIFSKEMCPKYPDFPKLRVRIGINTGPVLTGVLGTNLKMKFGAIGDAVNLASRLEGLCKLYGAQVVCSDSTIQACRHRDSFVFRELDLVAVKGKNKSARIYEVISQNAPLVSTFADRLIQNESDTPLTSSSSATTTAASTADSTSVSSTAKNKFDPKSQIDQDLSDSINVSSGLHQQVADTPQDNSPKPRIRNWLDSKDGPEPDVSRPRRLQIKSLRLTRAKKAERAERLTQSSIPLQFHPVNFDVKLAHRQRRAQIYEAALKAFQAGQFQQAQTTLQALPNDKDKAEQYLMERVSLAFNTYGPSHPSSLEEEGWSGVNSLDKKNF